MYANMELNLCKQVLLVPTIGVGGTSGCTQNTLIRQFGSQHLKQAINNEKKNFKTKLIRLESETTITQMGKTKVLNRRIPQNTNW